MLSSYRILDLADEQGSFCGRMLADCGADVIKVEPPKGDPSRNLGPFYHNIPDTEKSLHWFFLNANKRGITLNIETAAGREVFLELVKTADVVIESFPVGYLNKLELDYAALAKVKPDLILTSVSPFGQEGPYSHFKGSDLVCLGMSGMQYMCGEPDRAPVYVSFPQAYLNAGAQAVTGTLLALFYRERSGEGQHVDISVQGTMSSSYHTPDGSFIDFILLVLSPPLAMNLFPFTQTISSGDLVNLNKSCKPHSSTISLIVCHCESLMVSNTFRYKMYLKYFSFKHLMINFFAMVTDLAEPRPPHSI